MDDDRNEDYSELEDDDEPLGALGWDLSWAP